ncbi:hypothetical protein [Tumebacillus flagellatus]|nr:hypothetical protein [Tumebacillus flagellatus]
MEEELKYLELLIEAQKVDPHSANTTQRIENICACLDRHYGLPDIVVE